MDYVGGKFNVTFYPSSDDQVCQNVTILNNDNREPDKTFILMLVESSASDPRIQFGAISNITVTIIGKDWVNVQI